MIRRHYLCHPHKDANEHHSKHEEERKSNVCGISRQIIFTTTFNREWVQYSVNVIQSIQVKSQKGTLNKDFLLLIVGV